MMGCADLRMAGERPAHRRQQALAGHRIAQHQTLRVAPRRKQRFRFRDARIALCGCAASSRFTGSAMMSSIGALSLARRLTNDVLAPFSSKPPHKIGQQILVAADRRIDARRDGPPRRLPDVVVKLVQRFAHAMQPLELEVPVFAGKGFDRGKRVGVMRGELRIDQMRRRRAAHARRRDRKHRSRSCA